MQLVGENESMIHAGHRLHRAPCKVEVFLCCMLPIPSTGLKVPAAVASLVTLALRVALTLVLQPPFSLMLEFSIPHHCW